MARTARTIRATKPAGNARKPGRPAVANTPPKVTGAAAKRAVTVAASVPKLSKDALRAQVAKLERANATLRVKNREGNRTARTAAARIAELEDQVARLEQQVASQVAPVQPSASAGPRRKRQSRPPIGSDDAVPPLPDVAVEKPAPLDDEAATARETLEAQLRGE
jgi:small-conductance mechanosensitive channel